MTDNKNWFLDIEEKPNTSNHVPNQSLHITAVASGSPAERLNIKAGDWFVSVNNTAAAVADLPEILVSNQTVDYVFMREADMTIVSVSTPALPMGIRTRATPEDIVLSYESKPLDDFEGIRILWEQHEYSHIRHICGLKSTDVASDKLPLHDVLIAICDIEENIGDADKSYNIIHAFNKQHGGRLTTDISGLLDYYIAQFCRIQEDSNGYENAMYNAMECPYNQESPRLKAEAQRNNINYRDSSPHINGTFGPFGGMEVIVGDKDLQWNDAQITPYCLMLTYRGNQPYEDALKVYRSIYPFFKDKMRPMIMMTNVRERPEEHPEYFYSEDALIAENTPYYVLYGYKTFWADIVLSGAPEFLVIKNEGSKIFWHESLHDDFAYWEMLSRIE